MDFQLKTSFHTEDGKLHIKREQDVQRILDFNKERNIDGTNPHSDMRMVGSIPFVVIEMWLTESGLKLHSDEFKEYIKKKLLSGDFNKLIANGY